MGILTGLRATFAERPWRKSRDQKAYTRLGVRPHDIRRTVADHIKQEFGEAMMHAVLGHAPGRLTQTYGPTPRTSALREALQWWSDELAGATADTVAPGSSAPAQEAGTYEQDTRG
jgi:integrase